MSGRPAEPARSEIVHVGLTGGIAAGKSAVSARMAADGAEVIDADQLAREVLAPGTPGLAEVVEAFGPEVLDAEGALDRPALGRIVFADEAARDRLNAIVHPRVRAEAARRRRAAPPGSIVVEDIPLLVETGQHDRFDVVVVVRAPEEERVRRIVTDRGATTAEARARIAAQAADAERAAVADVVLENDSTPEALHRQVDELMAELRRRLRR